MSFANRRQDANVNPAAKSLPNAGSGTENSASIDLGGVSPFLQDIEIELESPSLNSTALPDTETVTYELEESSDDSTFTDVMILDESLQTGAGGNGHAGNKKRYRLPSDISRYIRIAAITSSGTGDCSGSNMTIRVMFP